MLYYLLLLNNNKPYYKSYYVINFLYLGCNPNILYECANLIFKNHYSISPPKFSNKYLFYSIIFDIYKSFIFYSNNQLFLFTLSINILDNSILLYGFIS